MPSSRPIDRLRDIVDNCERIDRHIAGMDFAAYARDEKTRDAVERCLQRISEAAYKLGSYLDDLYPEARWKATRGVGNPLRHQYDRIGDREIWDGVLDTLPAIRQSALSEIARLEAALRGNGSDNLPMPPEAPS
jgi:uncharacterized protein with HEPN domain